MPPSPGVKKTFSLKGRFFAPDVKKSVFRKAAQIQIQFALEDYIFFLVEKSHRKENCVIVCLVVYPHFIDWSKNKIQKRGNIFHKT